MKMIKIDLTSEETQLLVGLLDAGVRATGIRAVTRDAVTLLEKINEAIAQNNMNENNRDEKNG